MKCWYLVGIFPNCLVQKKVLCPSLEQNWYSMYALLRWLRSLRKDQFRSQVQKSKVSVTGKELRLQDLDCSVKVLRLMQDEDVYEPRAADSLIPLMTTKSLCYLPCQFNSEYELLKEVNVIMMYTEEKKYVELNIVYIRIIMA
uniref:Uncharacterized protein n=1 Tax=Tanacetum cinerariifolium TaxID=118510 RepID=A0A6L2JBK1_TANCI|nr:hypothetical protein [Tanacetum cinerariifolium]